MIFRLIYKKEIYLKNFVILPNISKKPSFMLSKLYAHIAPNLSVTEELKQTIEQYFTPLQIPKNTIIEEDGKIPQHLYFINEGYMRSFYYDNDGDEITTYLATPEQYMASFLSLSQQKVSSENIETITDCSLLKISREDFLKIIEQYPNFREYSLQIFEQAFAKMNQRANDLATLTAEQRYSQLLHNQGNILQNVPIQYIASFLGIKPQSLSRIRKQMIK
jgi:CRP/FNR family transcriptional regulator, anaerobic regulatory protein